MNDEELKKAVLDEAWKLELAGKKIPAAEELFVLMKHAMERAIDLTLQKAREEFPSRVGVMRASLLLNHL